MKILTFAFLVAVGTFLFMRLQDGWARIGDRAVKHDHRICEERK